jgi:parallel beta-helix repeat protein
VIEENEITSNIRCGAFASNSVSAVLRTNNVSENNEEGLYVYQCDGSQMIGNHFLKNLVGVRVYYSANSFCGKWLGRFESRVF